MKLEEIEREWEELKYRLVDDTYEYYALDRWLSIYEANKALIEEARRRNLFKPYPLYGKSTR